MNHLLANRPLQMLPIDFTVLEPSKDKENVLVMTDLFLPYSHKQWPPVIRKLLLLRCVWFNSGLITLVYRIEFIQGRNFESDIIKQLCKIYDTQKLNTTAYIYHVPSRRQWTDRTFQPHTSRFTQTSTTTEEEIILCYFCVQYVSKFQDWLQSFLFIFHVKWDFKTQLTSN